MRYNEGDIVCIKEKICGHGFSIGQRVKIHRVHYRDYSVSDLENKHTWYIIDRELRKITSILNNNTKVI